MRMLVLLLPMLCAGCLSYSKDGVKHTLVIGIGIVSTPASSNAPVRVTKTSVAGICVNQSQLSAGLSSTLTTEVSTNANALMDVSKNSFKPLKIRVFTE